MKYLSHDIIIEETKDKHDIIKFFKNNKYVYIGSKYNMEQEISRFINEIKESEIKENSLFIIFGFATGEHVKRLREHYKKNSILVLEPNSALVTYGENLKWIKSDDNIKIFNLDDAKIQEYINEFNVDSIQIKVFANYAKIFSEVFKRCLEYLKKHCINMKGNKVTKLLFSDMWFKTLMENLPFIVESVPSNAYKDLYKDKPAVIVSAGPSLEKNIDYLKECQNDFFIFTGGRTLKGLINKNINPDLLAVLDPGEKLYGLVKGYIENTDIPLFFYEGTNEQVVKNHKGKKILSRYSHSYSNFINTITDTQVIEGEGGGSVAHYMTLHAIYAGCNPIIFIGQDLAYTSDKQYSEFAKLREEKQDLSNTTVENEVYVEGVNGEKVRTDIYLNSFKVGFEKIIQKYPDIKFINATEGGARIHGTVEMKLTDAIKIYGRGSITKSIFPKYEINVKENALNELIKINKISGLLYDDLQEILKLIKNYNENKEKILKLEEKINQYINNLGIFGTLFYPIFYDILSKRYNFIEFIDEKTIKYTLDERKVIYKDILKKIEYALPYIKRTMQILEIR